MKNFNVNYERSYGIIYKKNLIRNFNLLNIYNTIFKVNKKKYFSLSLRYPNLISCQVILESSSLVK